MIFFTSLVWEIGDVPYPFFLLFHFESGYFPTSQNKYAKGFDILELRTMPMFSEDSYSTPGSVRKDYSLI